MGETLLNEIIGDFVAAVERTRPEADEVRDAAEQIFALATRLDWIDEIAADLETLKWRLAVGWERRLWEASTRAKRLTEAGDAAGAARALRPVVREIAEAGAEGPHPAERRPEVPVRGRRMNASDIRKKAVGLGIHPGKKRKHEIILAIQIAEGNTPCYGTNDGTCRHGDCCWIDDCAEQFRRLQR
jgi:hypothetical protein